MKKNLTSEERLEQYLDNRYDDDWQFQQLRKRVKAKAAEDAAKIPELEATPTGQRLKALGFKILQYNSGHGLPSERRIFMASPCHPKEHVVTYTFESREYDVYRSVARLLKPGWYTEEEFEAILTKMEQSPRFAPKPERAPRWINPATLNILKQEVHKSLPIIFKWREGVAIALKAGMPERTFGRFVSNRGLFDKVKAGVFLKKWTIAETRDNTE